MNVYDFDGTIYKKDASIMFYRYFVRKYPQFGISTFWNILKAFCKYKLRQCSKEAFKSEYFSFIRHIEDLTAFVDQFVDMESQNINAWYLNRQKEDDVIISASPDFLVRAFADSQMWRFLPECGSEGIAMEKRKWQDSEKNSETGRLMNFIRIPYQTNIWRKFPKRLF